MSPNVNTKTPTKDIAKLLAILSFVAAIFLWSLIVWSIATQTDSLNIKDFFTHSFSKTGISCLTLAVCLLILVGVYCLNISKKKNKQLFVMQQYVEVIKNADTDELTGLLNRSGFEKKATEVINKTVNNSTSHALLFMDLDHIKIVNDTVSREAGDELLSKVGDLIQKKFGGSNILARLWGDEFGILLCNSQQQEAVKQAQEIIKSINSYRLDWDDKQITIGATIGFVMIDSNAISFPNLLGRASSACYSAKRNNRGSVVKYSQEHASSYQDMRVSMQIKHAIDQNQFMLYHQRILDITENDTQVSASEILIRMKGETDEKILTPGIFLPIAERYNMMRAIDRWVINNLFQYIKDHQQDLSKKGHRFYINLSGDSLNDDSFYDFLTEKISEYDINTQLLCFEITETIAIQNLQNAAYLIGFLKRLGCSFALDDFGTGTSSFAYLKYLPIDYLKIDGVFIKDIANDSIDYEIVKAIKRICNTMKIKVIAELVEDEKTINFLKQLNIDFAQGYAIQKPVPLE